MRPLLSKMFPSRYPRQQSDKYYPYNSSGTEATGKSRDTEKGTLTQLSTPPQRPAPIHGVTSSDDTLFFAPPLNQQTQSRPDDSYMHTGIARGQRPALTPGVSSSDDSLFISARNDVPLRPDITAQVETHIAGGGRPSRRTSEENPIMVQYDIIQTAQRSGAP